MFITVNTKNKDDRKQGKQNIIKCCKTKCVELEAG